VRNNLVEENKLSLKSIIISLIAIFMSLFHLYTGAFGSFPVEIQRSIHLFLALLLIFLIRPYRKNKEEAQKSIPVIDLILIAATFLVFIYPIVYHEELTSRFTFVSPLTNVQITLGIIAVLVVLEATRRLAGWVLPIIALLFMIYPFIPQLPGVLKHGGYEIGILMDIQYISTEGIFGTPLGASASFIALFIIFGAFLQKSGLGILLMDLSQGLAGKYRGGPAKVSVIGSALMGTISGSAVSNVVTTGTMTIPLMKRIGYKPHFAGAVEAVASTGGQLMPPLMGAIAFLMSQYTNIPYIKIAQYSLIPALLFFFGVFLGVHWEALRLNLKGYEKSELPDWVTSFKNYGHLLIPIIVLLSLLSLGHSPQYSVVYSILGIILIAALRKQTRMNVKSIIEALINGGKGAILVAATTATAGMIAGVFGLTGIGLRLSDTILSFSGNYLILALFLTMVTSIILGMGIPGTASYIVQVALTIPIVITLLVENGMDKSTAVLIAHMFVMYYANLAAITPPDAMAAIAASGIAGSPPMKTAVTATRLGFVAFLVPYLFVYRPSLLMLGSPLEILQDLVIAIFSIYVLSMGLSGFFLTKLKIIERLLVLTGGGIILLIPGWETNLIGGFLVAIFFFLQVQTKKRMNTISA
jgi:TRAP transporter 4TM/12TM fusion protein